MILFIESTEKCDAYFIDPITKEKLKIGTCYKHVKKEVLNEWVNSINSGYFSQMSECLELIAAYES